MWRMHHFVLKSFIQFRSKVQGSTHKLCNLNFTSLLYPSIFSLLLVCNTAHAVVTYNGTEGVNAQVFNNVCVGCHFDGSGLPVWAVYATADANIANIVYRINLPIGDSLLMPPGAKMSATLLNLVGAWDAANEPLNAAPSISTNGATAITKIAATLNANNIAQNGSTITTLRFRYSTVSSTVTSGGGFTTNMTAVAGTGGGTATFTRSSALSLLSCGTTYYYRAEAINGIGTTNTGVANFTTTACSPPIISEGNGPLTINMSEDSSPIPFNLTLNATDLDGGTLSWSATQPSSGSTSVSGSGSSKVIIYNHVANYFGSTSFTVTVTDNTGLTDSVLVNVNLAAVNDAPTIGNIPAASIAQGNSYSFIPSYSDPDGPSRTYSSTGSALPSWLNLNTSSGALSGTPGPADIGITTGLRITVSDGLLTASLSAFSIQVVNSNDPPVINGTPANTVLQNATYFFDAGANTIDPDVSLGDVLTFTINVKPSWATLNPNTGVLTGVPGPTDIATTAGMIITVTDRALATDTLGPFSITVINVNDQPIFVNFNPPTGATESTLYSYQVVITDPDDVNNGVDLLFSLSNAPAGMSISDTGLITWTPAPNTSTSGTVTVTVQDGLENGVSPISSTFAVNVGILDPDGDTIPSHLDNCPDHANTDQLDTDNDGRGDVCDPDDTNDNIIDSPIVFTITQGPPNTSGTHVFQDLEPVTITGTLRDSNAVGTFTYEWTSSHTDLMTIAATNANELVFNPTALTLPTTVTQLVRELKLRVIDGSSAIQNPLMLSIKANSTNPALFDCNGDGIVIGDSIDCDNDGIDNVTEGAGDTDGDGVPNYLDNDTLAGHEIDIETVAVPIKHIANTQNTLRIGIGAIARYAGRSHILVDTSDIRNFGGNNGTAVTNAIDSTHHFTSSIFDFEITGLTAAGDSATIVIPLQSNLPAGAVYRKYKSNNGWQSFVVNASNSISSAKGLLGLCPAPGSSAYTTGLTAFNDCVQLIIQDGGPNDTDGIMNGMIRDPGGIAVPINTTSFTPPASNNKARLGGSAIHPLEAGLLLLWFIYLHKRRHTRMMKQG